MIGSILFSDGGQRCRLQRGRLLEATLVLKLEDLRVARVKLLDRSDRAAPLGGSPRRLGVRLDERRAVLGPLVGVAQLTLAQKADLDQARAIELMLAQPSMIKRPVLDLGDRTLVGFKPDLYAAALATSN